MEKIKIRIYFFFLIYFLFNSNINCDVCSGCDKSGNLCIHHDASTESCPPKCVYDVEKKDCFPCDDIERGGYYICNENGCKELFHGYSEVSLSRSLRKFYQKELPGSKETGGSSLVSKTYYSF